MVFDLKVVFTGIGAFISNLNQDRICVAMPGGEGLFSLDDEYLCHHRSYVESLADSGVSVPWTSIRQYSVSLDFSSDYPNDNPDIKLPREVAGPFLAELQTAMGSVNAVTDPAVVSRNPPRVVLAQIFLRKGVLALSPYNVVKWRIEPMYPEDGAAAVEQNLAHEVILTLRNLKTATLSFAPLGGSPDRNPLDLTSPSGAPVLLRVANTCMDAEGQGEPYYPARDRDFKWYYELMTKELRSGVKKELEARIKGRSKQGELAFPRRVGEQLVKGPNCFSAILPSVSF